MIHKIKLRFFEDEATGEWGLAHANSIDREEPFNAFWSHQGIFHDVFEHYFEDVSPYFSGDYAFNVGGEVAAMGHYAYYMYNFYPEKRLFNRQSHFNLDDAVIGSTIDEMRDGIMEGTSRFGLKLMSKVPRQKEDGYDLRHICGIIDEHYDKVRGYEVGKTDWTPEGEDEYAFGRAYKRSVTRAKLRDLYIWGWKQAEKIAPRNDHNRAVFDKFLDDWNEITNTNFAKELGEVFKYVEFTVVGGEEMKWDCKWITHENEIVSHSRFPMEGYYEIAFPGEDWENAEVSNYADY